MNKLFLFGFAMIFFTACNEKQRYAQKSPEIETFKAVIKDYNDQNWDAMRAHYADTAKTYNNTIDKPTTLDEEMALHQQVAQDFSERGFVKDEDEYEMVVTDKGETWVNFWGEWKGKLAANNKELNVPIHLTAQFKDGKIVRSSGFWDNTPLVLAMQEIERNNNMAIDEKIMRQTIKTITKAWNSNDKKMMASSMVDNFIRTENGNVVAENPSEYAAKLMDVYHGGFPDFKVTIDKVETMGNKAYLNWTCTGTNTGTFQDSPATNKSIVTHGFSQWTFNEEGKALREDGYYDNLIVFAQLGYDMPKLK